VSDQQSLEQQGYIRITDPDEPIYRIFPLWFLEQSLKARTLALVLPSMWEDPHETLCARILLAGGTPADFAATVYGQSWSRTSESDTLLRAYSRVVKDPILGRNTAPRDEGVRVRSTPRKLLTALKSFCTRNANRAPDEHCFIGTVRYEPRNAIERLVRDLAASHQGPRIAGRQRCELQLLKRNMFAHEDEVRLIYVCSADDNWASHHLVIPVPIRPNEDFEELTFDPRLDEDERGARVATMRALGYQGLITADDYSYNGLVYLQVATPLADPKLESAPQQVKEANR
jgi:hypothetical protein